MRSPSKPFDLQSYHYQLPEELIAQQPLGRREQARLLIIDRHKGTFRHEIFSRLNDYLPPYSSIVVNNSKVIPARLLGRRASGGAVEIFLLNPIDEYRWEVLLRPLKKIRPEETVHFDAGIKAVLEDKDHKIVRFNKKNIVRHLQKVGHIPLPPYIQRPDNAGDRKDYQTVYAKEAGSVASPTAGLHFTKGLIQKLRRHGHCFLELTLHINYGTFKPVESQDIRDHRMHREHYWIKPEIYKAVILPDKNIRGQAAAGSQGRSIVAVGTTSCRVLESVVRNQIPAGTTSLFIYPGFQFKAVDALITNFHLPYSSLLMLVCAFGGYDLVMRAYREAIQKRYRFYSYGDAMLIV